MKSVPRPTGGRRRKNGERNSMERKGDPRIAGPILSPSLFPPLLLLSLIKSREGGRPGHVGNAWFLEASTVYAPPSRISAVVRVN